LIILNILLKFDRKFKRIEVAGEIKYRDLRLWERLKLQGDPEGDTKRQDKERGNSASDQQ
jgi:hypothetical protein